MYPKLGKDIVTGFKKYFKENEPDNEIEVRIEGIGKGIDTEKILNTIQESTLSDEIDLIVNYSTPFTEESILNYSNSLDIPLVSVDTGATLNHQMKMTDTYYKVDFNLCKATYAAGYHIANQTEQGCRIMTITSFHDAGYHMLAAFESGIAALKKKDIHLFHTVIHKDFPSLSWENIFKTIREEKPDFIHLSLNDPIDYNNFFDFLKTEELIDDIRVFTHSIAVDYFMEAQADIKIYSATNWLPPKQNPLAVPLSILGYEAGIASLGLHNKRSYGEINKSIAEKSPRRWIIDKNGELNPDFFLRLSSLAPQVNTLDISEERIVHDNFKNLPPTEVLGGWFNPYMCAE